MSTGIESPGIATSLQVSPISTRQHESSILEEPLFLKLLCLERKRAERSRKRFALVLVDLKDAGAETFLRGAIGELPGAIRETDIVGWHRDQQVLGIILTEINWTDTADLISRLTEKVQTSLQSNLPAELFEKIRVSCYVFPEDWDEGNSVRAAESSLFPELAVEDDLSRPSRIVKRCIDVVGSGAALLLLSPLILIVGVLIKLTSKGPVLFRQQRIGQFGKSFEMLKLRSMQDQSDPAIHRQFVRSLIAGKTITGKESAGKWDGERTRIYKLTDDPRITRIGKWLRRSSVDEIPQFWNVFRGEMSLVGPRPPVQYEVMSYDIWHRKRILDAKPGITGLWQVSGRSSTSFNDMVRLDLKYAKSWSLALDLKILWRTPWAVFSRNGAY